MDSISLLMIHQEEVNDNLYILLNDTEATRATLVWISMAALVRWLPNNVNM